MKSPGWFTRLSQAFREAPATMTICTLWIVVFLGMAWEQSGLGPGRNLLVGEIRLSTADRFGDLTARAVRDGQPWRLLTATFVHFNLLHLGINLFGMYQLGMVLESWYGSAQFLAIYAFIGVLGNALGVISKTLLGTWLPNVAAFQDHPSGGGSTVLCGLIALLAVVGWRSRSRFGTIVKAEMIGILAFTAIMGIAIPRIDNFGHGGGALAGALVGFLHRPLLCAYERPRIKKSFGVLATLVLLAAAGAQFGFGVPEPSEPVARPNEARLRQQFEVAATSVRRLVLIANLYGKVAQRYPGMWGQVDLLAIDPSLGAPTRPSAQVLRRSLMMTLSSLEANPDGLNEGPTADCFERVGTLVRNVVKAPPTPGELTEFGRCIRSLLDRAGTRLVQLKLVVDQLEASKRQPESVAPD